ncbi:hypothetical protein ABPG73_019307 [Tetrahymena malaccensis]
MCIRNCGKGTYHSFYPSDFILVQYCYPCISNCQACNDDSTCNQCNPGYAYDSQNRACVLACTEGCSDCSQNEQSCAQCMNGYTMKTNPNNSSLQYCQKNCSGGQYAYVTNTTKMSQECRSCIPYCLSCNGSNDCSNCQSGYGYNPQNIQCAQCTEGCLLCDQNQSCSQCTTGYTQTTNPNNVSLQYCKKNCAVGQYTQVTNQQTMAQQYIWIYKFMSLSMYNYVTRVVLKSQMSLLTYKSTLILCQI